LLALTTYLNEMEALSKEPEEIAQSFTVSELLLDQVISCYLTLNYKSSKLIGDRSLCQIAIAIANRIAKSDIWQYRD
jgi:hypothetical protein